jgi:hypothetical protein
MPNVPHIRHLAAEIRLPDLSDAASVAAWLNERGGRRFTSADAERLLGALEALYEVVCTMGDMTDIAMDPSPSGTAS